MPSKDDTYRNLEKPSLFWRAGSYQTILTVAALCRGFLYGLNRTEVHGLPRFLDLLKSRADYKTRTKGLVTVSNHVCVMDDPFIWGVLPLSFTAFDGYMNHRWSFGSHDICFKAGLRSHFFTLGQTLPTQRHAHSAYGGLFQPTMTEAVRLLSKINTKEPASCGHLPHHDHRLTRTPHVPSWPRDCVDPFSELPVAPYYASRPNEERYYLAPSRYACNSYSWVHIFPEGMIHQSEDMRMRYFKWGVARLILEPPECPDVVPIFIDGTNNILHESRTFPRFIPRPNNDVTVTIGSRVNTQAIFGDLRARWQQLVEKNAGTTTGDELNRKSQLGIIPASLQTHPEAVELRIECTRRVREQVLQLRRERGYPEEDPKATWAETWRKEGPELEGQMEDGTWVKDT